MKKRIIIPLSALAAVIFLVFLIISAERKMVETLPDGVKAFSYDMTSSFLIPLPEGYLLFDTGYDKSYDDFIKQLGAEKISLDEIKYVLLSHHHDDHSGFVGKIVAENPDVKIIIHWKTVPLLAAGENNINNGGGIINPAINALFKLKLMLTPDWDFTFPPYIPRDVDIILEDDETDLKELTGIDAVVICTPGHTSDSISLLYNKKYLFCGDLSSNMLNFFGAANLTIFNENLNDVYNSWERMLERKIEVLIPSHGKPFASPRLRKNMRAREQDSIVPYP